MRDWPKTGYRGFYSKAPPQRGRFGDAFFHVNPERQLRVDIWRMGAQGMAPAADYTDIWRMSVRAEQQILGVEDYATLAEAKEAGISLYASEYRFAPPYPEPSPYDPWG